MPNWSLLVQLKEILFRRAENKLLQKMTINMVKETITSLTAGEGLIGLHIMVVPGVQ